MNTGQERAINQKGTFLFCRNYEDYGVCLPSLPPSLPPSLLSFFPFRYINQKGSQEASKSSHRYRVGAAGVPYLAGGVLVTARLKSCRPDFDMCGGGVYGAPGYPLACFSPAPLSSRLHQKAEELQAPHDAAQTCQPSLVALRSHCTIGRLWTSVLGLLPSSSVTLGNSPAFCSSVSRE